MAGLATRSYHALVNRIDSTICYACMQAAGMVNDHLAGRFRHAQLQAKR